MNDELLWVLGLLLATVVLFITGKVRMDVVALLVIVAFVLSGTLTLAEATAGFSDPNVLLYRRAVRHRRRGGAHGSCACCC